MGWLGGKINMAAVPVKRPIASGIIVLIILDFGNRCWFFGHIFALASSVYLGQKVGYLPITCVQWKIKNLENQ